MVKGAPGHWVIGMMVVQGLMLKMTFRGVPAGRDHRSREVVERRRWALRGEEAGLDMPDTGSERPNVLVLGLLG